MASLDDQAEGLRQRNVVITGMTDDQARQTVLQLNAVEEEKGQNEGMKKTFGRTSTGTVFTVPATKDMVSQLLSPSEPKNISDLLVLLVLLAHGLVLWALPQPWKIPMIFLSFAFWRISYNVGIGWLLHKQSHQQTLIRWARKSKLFDDKKNCDRPRLRAFMKHELEIKIPEDYNYDTAPLEYNTWLVFRRVVDLILMCDFTSYMLFAFSCGGRPSNESTLLTCGRWLFGLVLFFFNLWVKLDAHRVVKDFAWYWGDFFFLIDQELTFDGVFEMAPHPMYSIGYVGYYGISIMAASYKVLFASIIAHTLQFIFLVLVENPHIERTYNAPPPRRQINDVPNAANGRPVSTRTDTEDTWPNPSFKQPPATHKLLGIQNLDLYRTTDSAVVMLMLLMFALTVLTPTTPSYQALFVTIAVACRLWFSVGIGYLLNRQSVKKKWTRHFVKYGESTGEAWRQWKGTYHLSMMFCYASFGAAAWKMYAFPSNWNQGYVLLHHVIGLGLVLLQFWVSFSVYDTLGEFGWFYGDFFFGRSSKLTYSGIYRFLNNPERILGLAGVWGIALMTRSRAMFAVALLSHTLSHALIQLVERPHMQKLYGRSIRQDAGLVRSLRRSLPPPFRQWQDDVDKKVGELFDTIEEFLQQNKSRLIAASNCFSKTILSKYSSRISITTVEAELADLDPRGYAIEICGDPAHPQSQKKLPIKVDERRGSYTDDDIDTYQQLLLPYGAPIKIKWTAPVNHSKTDWIGLYMIADNPSRDLTRVPSGGRWIATNAGEYDSSWADIGLVKSDTKSMRKSRDGAEVACVTGEMIFSGDKLWWTQGSFEFRYHHNGKHNVLAISLPFEVKISRFHDGDFDMNGAAITAQSSIDTYVRHSIERTLLPLVQDCFDRDPEIAPRTAQETFGGLVERDGKFSRRVVYAVLHMFGIEFAGEVVKADGKVENLAWRIWEAKKVLAPYSLSHSRGTGTPIEKEIKKA